MMETPSETGPLPDRDDTELLSPLDVLLQAMRHCWKKRADKEAINCAKFAAPYVHARRAAARGRLGGDVGKMTDAEIAEALRR